MIWTAIGLIGVGFGWSNLRFSKRYLDALEVMNGKNLSQHRIMKIIAYGHFRNDLLRMFALLTITFIGIFSMVVPSPETTNGHHITFSGIIVTCGIFAITVEIIIASILDKNQRDAMEEMFTDGH